MAFCLLPEKVEAFKQALANKAIDISDVINMTTEERTALFHEYAGADAKEINTAFEQKLVLKNRMLGIQNLVSKLGQFGKDSPEKIAERAKDLEDYKAAQATRIFTPAEHQSFLNDLADKKVGTHIDLATANKVGELTAAVRAAKDEGTTNLSGMSDKYLQARSALNHFIDAQTPLHPAKAILDNVLTTMRNFMLMNPATPLKTIESQAVNAMTDAISRRIGNLSLGGKSGDLASTAFKEAQATFKKTGANIASMESADDVHALNKGENFGVSNHSNTGAAAPLRLAETATRLAAKVTTKVAIDFEHNITFTNFYQRTFYDAANILATKFAKADGVTGGDIKGRADEIFSDAARIEPQTEAGKQVRQQAQAQAARITNTNDTWVSKLAIGFKNVMNNLPGGLPIGDVVYPIAKIPANVIANGIDNAGAGIPVAVRDVMQGRVKIQSADPDVRYEGMAQLARGIQRTARIGGTLATAAYLTSQFSKQDFRSDIYGDHFFKVGNTWINTEYLQVVSPAFAGMMIAKANAANPVEGMVDYTAGSLSGLANAPAFDGLAQAAQVAISTHPATTAGKAISTFFESRDQPAFLSNTGIYDIEQGKTRPVDRLLFGANGLESQQDVDADTVATAAKAAATRKANAAAK